MNYGYGSKTSFSQKRFWKACKSAYVVKREFRRRWCQRCARLRVIFANNRILDPGAYIKCMQLCTKLPKCEVWMSCSNKSYATCLTGAKRWYMFENKPSCLRKRESELTLASGQNFSYFFEFPQVALAQMRLAGGPLSVNLCRCCYSYASSHNTPSVRVQSLLGLVVVQVFFYSLIFIKSFRSRQAHGFKLQDLSK